MEKEAPPSPEKTPDADAVETLNLPPESDESTTADAPEAGDDQTLTCVQCGSQFVFSVDEQRFFKERDLHAPPKRCKSCRQERRKARRGGRRGGMKDYRGPAFREKRKLDKMYRSPAFQKQQDVEGIYRSPAFQGAQEDPNEIYRSPAFQGAQEDPNEIYRAPAFQRPVFDDDDEAAAQPTEPLDEAEHDLELGPPPGFREPRSPDEIYRSPAFSNTDPANYAPSYRRRQLHEITCSECGAKAKIPFKPQKGRPVFCRDCFQKHR